MENSVKIERIRPKFLHNKPHFTNLVTAKEAKDPSLRTCGIDQGWRPSGAGDLAAQMTYIYKTIRKSLAMAGATPANVVRQRVFVGLKLEHRPLIMQAMMDFYGNSGSASTCVGGSSPCRRRNCGNRHHRCREWSLKTAFTLAPRPCSTAGTYLGPDAIGGNCLYICRGSYGCDE